MEFFLNIIAEITPKPRTALFQGGEDDEHIAPQIIQLGSFIFDENKTIMMKEGVLANTATLETSLFFKGIICTREKRSKKYSGRWPDIFIDPEKPCTWR